MYNRFQINYIHDVSAIYNLYNSLQFINCVKIYVNTQTYSTSKRQLLLLKLNTSRKEN